MLQNLPDWKCLLEIMKVRINNVEKTFDKPTRIIEMVRDENRDYMAAKVNNRLRELNYIVSDDADIELLGLDNSSVTRMYQATLRYVTVMAVNKLYPKAKITFNYSNLEELERISNILRKQ